MSTIHDCRHADKFLLKKRPSASQDTSPGQAQTHHPQKLPLLHKHRHALKSTDCSTLDFKETLSSTILVHCAGFCTCVKNKFTLVCNPPCNLLHSSRKLHVICYTILESFTIEAQYHCQTFSMGFATSVVRAKKDKLDQENAEDATANSKNRSQQPIGIV